MKFKTLIAIGALVALIFTVGTIVRAAAPTAVAMDTSDMYHLQAIVTKQQLVQQQMNNLYIQFINANPEAKALRQQLDDLTTQQNALVDLIFKQAKLDRAQYGIDVEKGQLTKIEKPGK